MKIYKVGDTINFTIELNDSDDLQMKLMIENGMKTEVFSTMISDCTFISGNKWLCTISHNTTKKWKAGTYTISSAVWTENRGWQKSASNTLELIIEDSRIGR